MATKKKPKLADVLKPNLYTLLSEAVEAGLAYGVTRANKYNVKPKITTIQDYQHTAIMDAICERFDFADEIY